MYCQQNQLFFQSTMTLRDCSDENVILNTEILLLLFEFFFWQTLNYEFQCRTGSLEYPQLIRSSCVCNFCTFCFGRSNEHEHEEVWQTFVLILMYPALDMQNYHYRIFRQNLLSSTSDNGIKFALTKLKSSINRILKVQAAKMALQNIYQTRSLIFS